MAETEQLFDYSEEVPPGPGFLVPEFSMDPAGTSSWGIKYDRLDAVYEQCEPREFYRCIFPEGSLERQGHPEDAKGNGIVITIDEQTGRARKTILTDGLEQLDDLLRERFVVCSPISYFGRSRRADHALWLHALALDIDYVDLDHLNNMINWFENLDAMPRPTFVVNSGHGVHLYYVLDQPIAMYAKNQRELLKLKKGLVDQIWTRYTSAHPERKEALGIVQGFRMVGSRTKISAKSGGEDTKLCAFRTGRKVDVDYLNGYVSATYQAHIDQTSVFTLEAAREMWPDWYERRVVKGEEPGRWHVKRDLYDWFLRKVYDGGKVGHRYFCMMSLAIYAAKCDVPEEELRRDAMKLQKHLNRLGEKSGEPFGWDEAEKALECYNESYVKFPRETIERITAISMPANKRNGRDQATHLARIRKLQEFDYPDGSWRGRPKGSKNKRHPKRDAVRDYVAKHPEANHSEIARALGVSRPTVIKWLKTEAKE